MNTSHRWPLLVLVSVSLWLFLACPLCGSVGAVYLEPSPYLTFTNSPFNTGGFSYFYLETFEDGALNTPGGTINNGWLVTGPGNLDTPGGVAKAFPANSNLTAKAHPCPKCHTVTLQITTTNWQIKVPLKEVLHKLEIWIDSVRGAIPSGCFYSLIRMRSAHPGCIHDDSVGNDNYGPARKACRYRAA